MPNDKNVYILGAGFSKEIGLPLQDDFLLLAKEVYFRNPNLYKHFDNVFKYQDKLSKMRQFLSYPLLNLEHLFNIMEMDIFYSKSKDTSSIKKDFIKLICDVLKEQTPSPFYISGRGREADIKTFDGYNNYLSFLNLFIKKKDKNYLELYKDTIITFNYDLVIEATAALYNFYGLQKQSGVLDRIQLNTIFGKENIVSILICFLRKMVMTRFVIRRRSYFRKKRAQLSY